MPYLHNRHAAACTCHATQLLARHLRIYHTSPRSLAFHHHHHSLSKRHAFHQRHWGEIDTVGNVANGPNVWHARAAVLIHLEVIFWQVDVGQGLGCVSAFCVADDIINILSRNFAQSVGCVCAVCVCACALCVRCMWCV
jgi:hypothetical protein